MPFSGAATYHFCAASYQAPIAHTGRLSVPLTLQNRRQPPRARLPPTWRRRRLLPGRWPANIRPLPRRQRWIAPRLEAVALRLGGELERLVAGIDSYANGPSLGWRRPWRRQPEASPHEWLAKGPGEEGEERDDQEEGAGANVQSGVVGRRGRRCGWQGRERWRRRRRWRCGQRRWRRRR